MSRLNFVLNRSISKSLVLDLRPWVRQSSVSYLLYGLILTDLVEVVFLGVVPLKGFLMVMLNLILRTMDRFLRALLQTVTPERQPLLR